MKLGFTGTQKGSTHKQMLQFIEFLERHKTEITEFHHGDCMGADEEAHYIVQELFPKIKIIIHPPYNPKKRAYCVGGFIARPKDYIERNHNIVDMTDILFAMPFTNE